LLSFLDRVGPFMSACHPLHGKLKDIWREQRQAG
jgi:hypothetical protein